METPRSRHELDNLFNAIQRNPESAPIAHLLALCESISLQSIFSDNEEFDDVDALDVGLALGDFWLACAVLKSPPALPLNPVLRKSTIQSAEAHFERFLARCAMFRLFPPHTQSAKPSTREEKVARFQQVKQLRLKLADSLQRGDGGDGREVWRTRLELACLETLDEFDGIARELEVLEYMIRQQPSALQSLPPIQTNRPIEVTKVGSDFVMKKETFQNGVFKPYHLQPTISIEEYAEMEMQRMAREEEQKRSNPPQAGAVKSLNEMAELGLEDDVAQMELAVDKARKWDDWKDGVPKGSGVTKRL